VLSLVILQNKDFITHYHNNMKRD
jgi:hypothetical protein